MLERANVENSSPAFTWVKSILEAIHEALAIRDDIKNVAVFDRAQASVVVGCRQYAVGLGNSVAIPGSSVTGRAENGVTLLPYFHQFIGRFNRYLLDETAIRIFAEVVGHVPKFGVCERVTENGLLVEVVASGYGVRRKRTVIPTIGKETIFRLRFVFCLTVHIRKDFNGGILTERSPEPENGYHREDYEGKYEKEYTHGENLGSDLFDIGAADGFQELTRGLCVKFGVSGFNGDDHTIPCNLKEGIVFKKGVVVLRQ